MPQARVEIVSLGCAKNTVDSEEIAGALERAGIGSSAGEAAPRVVVINTCGFIQAATDESKDAIRSQVARKERGEVDRVVVVGCLAQRAGEALQAECPGIDALVGVGNVPAVVSAVSASVGGAGNLIQLAARPRHQWTETVERPISTEPWTAYLKISEGCDHSCTFCSIPSIRGAHVSKPLDRIEAEARWLAASGAREINLIAQDSTQYGYDFAGKCLLPEVLRRVAGVDGVDWVRVFYCYPSRVNEEVIAAITGTPGVCHYIDMPLQHADDAVLRRMRRPMSGDGYLRLLERFRVAAPDAAVRTTFVVGHPGETDAAFERLLAFVAEAQFDRVGAFMYSREEGTPSAEMPDQVPDAVKRERLDRLMAVQQEISLVRNRRWIGRTMDVLIEGVASEGRAVSRPGRGRRPVGAVAHGRTFRDGPEVDGRVTVPLRRIELGQFCRVRITGAQIYDLEGLPDEPMPGGVA